MTAVYSIRDQIYELEIKCYWLEQSLAFAGTSRTAAVTQAIQTLLQAYRKEQAILIASPTIQTQ